MPMVSIIVPIYNCEPYLRDCIDSILSQSFRDFELILVDDGSTDSCGEIIDEYAARDSRVTVIHQENGGQSSARNTGLDAASGSFVYISDSDDILEPSLLETVIPRFEEGYELISFGFETIPPENYVDVQHRDAPDTEQKFILTTDKDRFMFLTGPFRRRIIRWEPWNRVFRRDIIEKWNVRFPRSRGVYPEDMFFNYCYIAHISKILSIPDKLYGYRRNVEGSVSDRSRQDLMISTSHLLTEELYEHYRSSADCRYLAEHFPPLYYLLHKGALRRLRRHQWRNGLSIQKAREILWENIADYSDFKQIMIGMYSSPVVAESYRKDRGVVLQLTDRIYTGELLEIPRPGIIRTARRILLYLLCLLSSESHESAETSFCSNNHWHRRNKNV